MEQDTGFALLTKLYDVKAIIHYETTSRSSADGEWPSLIMSFSDDREHRLRPIVFSFEDRKQIIDLFVETDTRLAVVVGIFTKGLVSPAKLWEKNWCCYDWWSCKKT